jgi:NOL1/NOP2/fmu family ribosome biogenesis protein
MKILNKSDKKKIMSELERFGISELPHLLIQTGKNRIRGFTGNLSREEITILDNNTRIESAGLYLFKLDPEIRLSIDATHLLSSQISKKIFSLSEQQSQEWMKGKDIQINEKNKKGFFIIKSGNDFLGTGRISNSRIANFVPKQRRVKN